jgi:hypothetical protein
VSVCPAMTESFIILRCTIMDCWNIEFWITWHAEIGRQCLEFIRRRRVYKTHDTIRREIFPWYLSLMHERYILRSSNFLACLNLVEGDEFRPSRMWVILPGRAKGEGKSSDGARAFLHCSVCYATLTVTIVKGQRNKERNIVRMKKGKRTKEKR